MQKNIMKKLILSLIAITFYSHSNDYNPSIDWRKAFQSIVDVQRLKFELEVLNRTYYKLNTTDPADRIVGRQLLGHKEVDPFTQEVEKLLIPITYLEEKIKLLESDNTQEANTSK